MLCLMDLLIDWTPIQRRSAVPLLDLSMSFSEFGPLKSCGSAHHQLKHRIIARQSAKRLRRRPRLNRKIPLHRSRVAVQIRLQKLQLVPVRNTVQPEALPETPSLQGDLAHRLGIAHPLRPSSRGHQNPLPIHLHQVHRRRIDPPCLPATYLQQIDELGPNSYPHQKPKHTIENRLDTGRCPKLCNVFLCGHARILLRQHAKPEAANSDHFFRICSSRHSSPNANKNDASPHSTRLSEHPVAPSGTGARPL